MQWRVSTDAVTRAYGFDYDEINRIKAEKYAEKAPPLMQMKTVTVLTTLTTI